MPYPSFPIAANKPVFLDVFDPSFLGGHFPVDAAIDPPAFGVIVGGLGVGPTVGGNVVTVQQWIGFWFGWGAARNAPIYVPQIIGPRFAWVNLVGATDGGAIG